jgi:hypothetical protein
MKKRMLLILACGLSFAPAVLADANGTGEHDKISWFADVVPEGSINCKSDSTKNLPVQENETAPAGQPTHAGSANGR